MDHGEAEEAAGFELEYVVKPIPESCDRCGWTTVKLGTMLRLAGWDLCPRCFQGFKDWMNELKTDAQELPKASELLKSLRPGDFPK